MAITKHLANIYKSGELEREGTCSILEHMGNDGNRSCQNRFWDAKSLLIKFIRRAKKELIVIDAYPGVANGECCQCVNVTSCQFQFPIEEAA